MILKPVVDGQFWIVKNSVGEKIGTVQRAGNHVRVFVDDVTSEFDSIDAAIAAHSFEIEMPGQETISSKEWDVNGFPARTEPFNATYDAKLKVHMYTKKPESNSFYAAGFFVIENNSQLSQNLCPRLSTLKKNVWRGPFNNRVEMMEVLRKWSKEL